MPIINAQNHDIINEVDNILKNSINIFICEKFLPEKLFFIFLTQQFKNKKELYLILKKQPENCLKSQRLTTDK